MAGRVTFVGAVSAPPLLMEMREAVAAHLGERRVSEKANPAMVARTVVMLGVTFGAYAAILTGGFSPLAMLSLAIVMGVGIAGIGLGIAHDALHGAYSSDPRLNRLLGFTFDLVGASSYLWDHGHNVAHHTYTNIVGVDGDVASSPLLRKSPDAELRPGHRYQHLYAFPLYCLATLNWVFVKDYKDIFKREGGHRPSDIAGVLVLKGLYYAWSIVVPLLVLPVAWWQFLLGYLAMHLTTGLILGTVFQLAHLVEGVEFPVPDANGLVAEDWVAHQLATTSNFANGNRLLTWYLGGLNHQIEHHLFPRMCSTHYPSIRDVVRDIATRRGLRYRHQPGLFAAIASHYRFLKRMGVPAPAASESIRPAICA
jgi:linoleoyl-CoA desaturase